MHRRRKVLFTPATITGLLLVLAAVFRSPVAPVYGRNAPPAAAQAPTDLPPAPTDLTLMPVNVVGAVGVSGAQGVLPVDFTRILFVGNSITFHEPLRSHTGTWGMAASAADRDFVHRVQLQLAAQTGVIPEIATERWDVSWDSAAALAKAQQFAPTLVIVQVGDNAPQDMSHAAYVDILADFLRSVQGDGRTVVLAGVWYSAEREAWSSEVAQTLGLRFAPLRDIHSMDTIADPDCWDTDPICSHPGDAGMAQIAQRIVDILNAGQRYYLPWVGTNQ